MAVSIEVIDGAEVRVETGKGFIQFADLEAQGRNIRVEIKATHANLTKPVGSWVDTTNNALLLNVREAFEQRAEIEYAVHVKRKRDIDPAIPFANLSSDQKVRDLHSIRPAGAYRPESSSEAQRAPAERPTPTYGSTHGGPGAAPSVPEQGPPPARGVRRGVRIEEARPWERLNSDGSVNLGSYEAQATVGMASLAYKLLLEKNRVDAALKGGDVKAPSKAQVRRLGAFLLQAADAAQAAVRADGCADRMDSSHTRARGAIREVLDAYPVPWGATEVQQVAWRDTLAATAAMLLSTGVELLEAPVGSLEQVRAGEENPSPPAESSEPVASESPVQEELVPASSDEADLVEQAEANGEDPQEVLRRARARALASTSG